jgi:hypothetical protein
MISCMNWLIRCFSSEKLTEKKAKNELRVPFLRDFLVIFFVQTINSINNNQ